MFGESQPSLFNFQQPLFPPPTPVYGFNWKVWSVMVELMVASMSINESLVAHTSFEIKKNLLDSIEHINRCYERVASLAETSLGMESLSITRQLDDISSILTEASKTPNSLPDVSSYLESKGVPEVLGYIAFTYKDLEGLLNNLNFKH